MNVTHAALSAIFMNLRTTFNNTFDAVQTNYQKIAMTVPSTGGYVKYDWLGKFPKMERWVGKKEIKKLAYGGLCLSCPECTYPQCGFGR